MSTVKTIVAALTLATLASAAPLHASTVETFGQVNLTNHDNPPGYGDGFTAYTSSGFYPTLQGGAFTWTATDGHGLGALVPNWGFCIELPQSSAPGTHQIIKLEDAPALVTQSSTTYSPLQRADAIRKLWGRAFSSSWLAGGHQEELVAFSAAILEIVYATDNNWKIDDGAEGFQALFLPDGTSSLANGWLADIQDPNFDQSWAQANNLWVVSSPDGHDSVVALDLAVVPLPATALVGAHMLGLLGVGRWVKRRRQLA